jgi:hypothetical protein
LLAQAMPHMSLYQQVDPDPDDSDAVVRQALVLSGQSGSNSHVYDGTPPVIVVRVEVDGPGRAAARREAIIGIGTGGKPYQFLSLVDAQ